MGFWQWLASGVSPYIDTSVHNRLTTLEHRMALTDAALAELDAATTDIADELDELHAAAAAVDADLAEKIHGKADRLRALAADPENPVPDLVPQTPAPEVPGTQAGADDEQQSGVQGIAGINGN